MKKRQLIHILAMITLVTLGYYGYNYSQNYLVTTGYAKSDNLAANVNPNIITANTEFALKLFNKLCNESTDSNIFISPLSISTALTMVYSGSDGTTEHALRSTLGYENMSTHEIETGIENLLTSLDGVDNDVQLSNANSFWVKQGFDELVYAEYKETLETHYKGEYFARQFNQDTVNELNDWVKDNTHGTENKILTQQRIIRHPNPRKPLQDLFYEITENMASEARI